jgi:hypothetical protein
MALDSVTRGLLGGLIPGLMDVDVGKGKNVSTPGVPASPVSGDDKTGKKRKMYRPAAQLFKDDDLRLGSAGKLGM